MCYRTVSILQKTYAIFSGVDKGYVDLPPAWAKKQFRGAEESSEKATTEKHLYSNKPCQKAEVSVQCNVPLKSTMSTLLYCLLSEAKPEGCT